MELAIKNEQFGVPIEFNYQQLKDELDTSLKKYRELVYSEANLPEAKKDRASLNKLKKALTDARRETKKMCLEYYADFEKQVNELISLIDEPISTIDQQLDSYEQERIKGKQQLCKQIYEDVFAGSEIHDLTPYNKIHRKGWLNKSYSEKQIREDMQEIFDLVSSGIEAVREFQSKHETALIQTYLETFDMADVIASKKRFEEYERIQEEKKCKRQEEQQQQQADVVEESPGTEEQQPAIEETFEISFRVEGTPAQFQALKKFINASGMKILS